MDVSHTLGAATTDFWQSSGLRSFLLFLLHILLRKQTYSTPFFPVFQGARRL